MADKLAKFKQVAAQREAKVAAADGDSIDSDNASRGGRSNASKVEEAKAKVKAAKEKASGFMNKAKAVAIAAAEGGDVESALAGREERKIKKNVGKPLCCKV